MALSCLFVAEAELHLRHAGFARRWRWSTSFPLPPSPSKYSPRRPGPLGRRRSRPSIPSLRGVDFICTWNPLLMTEEGLRKALSKSDTTVGGADVVVEPTSPTKIQNCLFTMEPFSNEDFPAAFP